MLRLAALQRWRCRCSASSGAASRRVASRSASPTSSRPSSRWHSWKTNKKPTSFKICSSEHGKVADNLKIIIGMDEYDQRNSRSGLDSREACVTAGAARQWREPGARPGFILDPRDADGTLQTKAWPDAVYNFGGKFGSRSASQLLGLLREGGLGVVGRHH